MNYKKVLEELYSLDAPKWTLGLERIEGLLKKLGNPEKNLRCIHVAGTNGKGSVCAMLSSILSDAGYKVGLYTSPHLKKFNERIRINDKLITDKEIVKYYLTVKKHVTNQSFFEITTAMAFLYFKDKKVDFAVLETGLGGRLDATNVVKPLVSVITGIGCEHTDYLGKEIKKIAYEKAGIIKENTPGVTAAEGIALEKIKKISIKKNSKLLVINKNKIKKHYNKKIRNFDKNIRVKNNSINNHKNKYWAFDFNGHKNLVLGHLNAEFQIENAAVAVKAIEAIKSYHNIEINEPNIKNGLKNAEWPGRFQFVGRNILLDCAHNPDGFKILFKELKNIDYNKLILVAGFSNDKGIKTIAKIIRPLADKTIITKSGNERAAEPSTIKKYFNKKSIIIKNPKKALKYAKKIASKKDLILVAGSIFLVGEII
ncbi:bifunctional folylpolyglutamate synthase/dihydrofolate synthase [Candidatus Woesearchaeota archaeon]|nr:bifunctional folylpolyglutamate synthase/dihydrofolate synthase [Candidatus Woesearchaeota archaeon]